MKISKFILALFLIFIYQNDIVGQNQAENSTSNKNVIVEGRVIVAFNKDLPFNSKISIILKLYYSN